MQELKHNYGSNYHISADVFLQTRLAKLCTHECKQPEFNYIIEELYRHLIKEVIAREFPKQATKIKTRMADSDPAGYWSGSIIEADTKAITINIARAGTLPSHITFEMLNTVLNPDLVRQDHVIMARTTDEDGHVTGANFGESKIGGDIDKAIVIIPDPMGATGASIAKAVNHYKNKVDGNATKYISVHMMVTPDYIKKMQAEHPELIVYALRLDRGASSEKALAAIPGTYHNEESGLTDIQYIIPGGGGFGELMNNSFC